MKTLATWPGAHHLAAGGGLLFATVKAFAQYGPRSDASFAWGNVWEEVRAIPLAGGEELSVVKNQPGFADTTAPNLAADASGLYWIHAAEPAVLHLPHGQRDARLLALGDEASAVAPLPHPSYAPVLAGIALGADFVAWSGKTLRAMPKGGGAIRDLAADLEPARDHAAGERGVFLGPVVGMAADASAVYLALAPSNETSGAIIAVPVDGSRPRRLGEAVVAPCELPAPCEPVGLAVDGDHVYWTNAGDGTIARAPKRGGAPEVVARGQPSPVAIGVDEASVFWVNLGGEAGRLRDGSVARADK